MNNWGRKRVEVLFSNSLPRNHNGMNEPNQIHPVFPDRLLDLTSRSQQSVSRQGLLHAHSVLIHELHVNSTVLQKCVPHVRDTPPLIPFNCSELRVAIVSFFKLSLLFTFLSFMVYSPFIIYSIVK